jgi:diacylglycerol kinase
MRRRHIVLSFRDAGLGVAHVLRTQRNFRVQLAAGLAVIVLAALLRLPPSHCAILALAIAMVLAGEVANTVVEGLVDLVCPGPHETARVIKDAAAGGVLVLALGAAAAGLVLLGPPLLRALGVAERGLW